MRKLQIDWTGLSGAFESSFDMVRSYLDLETGQVVSISSEVARYADHAHYGSRDGDSSIPEWMREAISVATQVEDGYGTRYLPIPPSNDAESYNDLEGFIARVGDLQLRKQLAHVIHGPGAFRRFKETLENYPAERERWFAYRDDCERERMLEWLKREEIEPLTPPPQQEHVLIQEPADADAEGIARQEFIEELALLLLYLCSWEERVAPGLIVRKAWKGYPFDVLNTLEDHGLIHQSRKAKSAILTEEGIELAREIERRYKP
jgi:hypothetical protein